MDWVKSGTSYPLLPGDSPITYVYIMYVVSKSLNCVQYIFLYRLIYNNKECIYLWLVLITDVFNTNFNPHNPYNGWVGLYIILTYEIPWNQIFEENVSFLKKKWWHLKPWFTKYQIFTGFSHFLYEIILWKDELLKNNCVQK